MLLGTKAFPTTSIAASPDRTTLGAAVGTATVVVALSDGAGRAAPSARGGRDVNAYGQLVLPVAGVLGRGDG